MVPGEPGAGLVTVFNLQSSFDIDLTSDVVPPGQRKHEAVDVPPMESLYVPSGHDVQGTTPLRDHWPFGHSALHSSADLDSTPRVLAPDGQGVH